MNNPETTDGTASPVVHGDASFPPGVPVPPSPQEAPGPASRAPERDETAGPRGEDSAPDPGSRPVDCRHAWNQRNICTLCGHDPLAAVRAAQAEQGRRQRAQRGQYTRIADRPAGASYQAGQNRRGGRQ